MHAYLITYSERKDQCCPPSSYRQINEKTVLAENEALAVASLQGTGIEVKQIKRAD